MHNTLADQINALAARYNCPRKVHGNYNGQIFFFFFCKSIVQKWQNFRTEIIDLVLISRAWSCLSQGPARVKL